LSFPTEAGVNTNQSQGAAQDHFQHPGAFAEKNINHVTFGTISSENGEEVADSRVTDNRVSMIYCRTHY